MTPTLPNKQYDVVLHPLYEAIEDSEEYLNDPILMKYSEQRHGHHTAEMMEQYVKSFDHHNDHIWRISTPGWQAVGTITARRDVNNKIANLGILVWSQGSGFGTRAWQIVSDWLLSDGIRKIEAGTMAANGAMLRIFERTGMHYEAKIKDHFLLDGKPTDLIMAARFK